jgi:hypothetical protein
VERLAIHPALTIIPGSSNRQDMRLWTVESGFESLPRNSTSLMTMLVVALVGSSIAAMARR